MGRYSDSEDERRKRKKKKKKRSRSQSVSSDDSKLSSRPKKSKKSKHKRKSRSQSRDEYRRSRSRSRGRRSRSYDRRSRSRSRGRKSRSPNYRRSRSLSRERFSRRRSRSRSYERRSSRSYSRRSRSRSRYSRSKSRERHRVKSRRRSRSDDRSRGNSSRYDSRSPSRVKVKEEKPADPCTTVPGFSEMTPSEQVQVRMQMALKAAAAADEKIKEQLNRGLAPSGSLEDQMKFNSAVNDIESSTFVQTSFTSNRTDKPTVEVKKDDFSFGTAAEFKPDMNPRKALNLDDFTDFSHPNLRVDPDVKMERWIQRLTVLRRRKLEGEVIT